MFKNIPTFVVSLKRSTERRKYITAYLKSKNIHYELIEAVDGKTLTQEQIEAVTGQEGIIKINKISEDIFKEKNSKKKSEIMTRGTVGCALSHIKIFKRIVNEGLPYALILEDDALIEDSFDANFLEAIPQSWDVLLLGYSIDETSAVPHIPCSFWGRYKKGNFVIAKPVRMAYGTHGYMVSQQGARRLLQLTHPLQKPIDCLTGDSKLVKLLVFKKPIIGLNRAYSQFSTIVGYKKIYKKTGFFPEVNFKLMLRKILP